VTSAPARLPDPASTTVVVRELGHSDYLPVWEAMRRFTDARTPDTTDELWFVEHAPVYTLGTNDRNEPFDNPGIPVIKTDRGGQITYHGPGQIVVYVLMDLRRRAWGVKLLVRKIEQAVIDLLADHGIEGQRRENAPGIYVEGRKIAQLGLRIRHGASYHGLSFNANMDLEPFRRIKPCGYAGLETIDLAQLLGSAQRLPSGLQPQLLASLLKNLDYLSTHNR